MLTSLHRYSHVARNFSTTVRVFVKLEAEIYEQIEKNELKPRKHPGILKRPIFSLPQDVMKAIDIVVGDTPRQMLIKEGYEFSRYLFSRKAPPEKDAILQKRQECHSEVVDSVPVNLNELDADEEKYYSQVIKTKVDILLKERLYNWHKIEYARHKGLVYLFSRAAPEFAVLSQIFQEISLRYDFKPKTLFDFASGVGTVIWAANSIWPKTLKHIYTVDSSSHMNDLSYDIYSLLKDKSLKDKIFQRQFLPASMKENYDMVTCAYTLLELPSLITRLETILNLWQKTKHILVLVEQGTDSGFKVLNEARDFILGLNKKNEQYSSHILAPCPHDFPCPTANENSVCRFEANYMREKLSSRAQRKEYYSYVVFAKGKRDVNDKQWPRIISPVLVRSRHAICRLCTKFGTRQEVIISNGKHGKITHHCARSSSWGDRLPIELKPEEPKSESSTS